MPLLQEVGFWRNRVFSKRRDRVTVSVSVGYVEIEGRGELVGRGTGRMHVVRLADVVAGVRRTSKRRRGGRIEILEP